MDSLDRYTSDKLAALAARSLLRELGITERASQARVRRAGRELISFSCNDYLGLSTHPEIIAAAIAATRRYGVGAGGSRAVTGNHPLYGELEARLAAHKGTADARSSSGPATSPIAGSYLRCSARTMCCSSTRSRTMPGRSPTMRMASASCRWEPFLNPFPCTWVRYRRPSAGMIVGAVFLFFNMRKWKREHEEMMRKAKSGDLFKFKE